MITTINEFRAIQEAKQTAKDKWWDKNYRALIDYASELDRDDWKSLVGKGEDTEDTVDAIMDQTGKHKAVDLLNQCTIAQLNDFIGKGKIDEKKKKSKLSKAAKKFISDKIEFLIGKEGKPRKQAVAMAYSYAEREGLIKEDVQTDAAKFNIDIKPSEFDGKPMNVWTMNIANDMKFGNWESAMRWLIDLWKSDEDLYYFFRGELSTNDELVIGDQIFAGIDVQDHMKLVSESIINEGHSGEIGPLDNAKTKEEAEVIVRRWIRNDKEDGDGDYKKFRDVKWLGKTTEDKMDKESMKWEDQYVILGEVDGEIWMARSSRS